VRGDGHEPTHLATLRQGTVVGEINFLLASQRTADARALRDSRLMVLSNDALDALEGVGKQAVTSLMSTIARVLALRLANMDRELVAFKHRLLESHPETADVADSLTDRRDALMHEWCF
jgi:CRP-like cAMP-binding protein